jgi:hypothetical protein
MKEGHRAKIPLAKIAIAIATLALATQTARAQGIKPAGAPSPKTHPPARPAPKKPAASSADAGSLSSSAATIPALVPSAPQGGVVATDAGAGVVEAKTLDGGARVFKFRELDIEGRLKSPQLVYFLRRVRAEFAAGDLGHRSFLREMSETRKESAF